MTQIMGYEYADVRLFQKNDGLSYHDRVIDVWCFDVVTIEIFPDYVTK